MRGRLSDIVLAQNIIEIGKLVLLAETRLGELFSQMPKQTNNNPNGNNQFRTNSPHEEIDLDEPELEKPKPKLEVAAEMGFNKNQVAQFQKLADNPDAVQKAIDDAQITAEQVTFAKIKLGELLADLPKATTNHKKKDLEIDSHVDLVKPKAESIAELGITQKQAERLQQMAKNPEAKIWILKNQLGRRNLIASVRIKLALLVEENIAANAKARQAEYHGNQYQSAPEDICPQVQDEVPLKRDRQAAPEIKAARAEKILRVRPKKKTGGKIPPYLCRILGGM